MDEVLENWRLEDHMDAILSLGVTKLVDLLTTEKINLTRSERGQAPRPAALGRALRRLDQRADRRALEPAAPAVGLSPALDAARDLQIGFGTTLVVIALIATFPSLLSLRILPWLIVPILAGWMYWGWRLIRAEWFARDIRKGQRVLSRDPAALRWELLWFKPSELGGQPLADGFAAKRRRAL